MPYKFKYGLPFCTGICLSRGRSNMTNQASRTAVNCDPRQPDKGGPVVVGSLETISKGASTLPVSAQKRLHNLPDDLTTKVNILYHTDAREALLKAMFVET